MYELCTYDDFYMLQYRVLVLNLLFQNASPLSVSLYNEITDVKGYGQVWTGLRLRKDVACLGDYSNLSFLLDPPKFSTGDFSEPLSAGGGD